MMENKVVLITGAAGSIGEATARKFGLLGANVALHGRPGSYGKLMQIATKIDGTALRARCFESDISNVAETRRLITEVKNAFGSIDILVNNAGVIRKALLGDIDEDHFYVHVDVNMKAPLFLMQAAAECFGEKGGSIINIGSTLAEAPSAGTAVYSASKAALIAMSQAFAKELGRRNIRVNVISPGLTESGMHEKTSAARRATVGLATPLGTRFGRPEEIADAVVFMASDGAGWITGKNLTVDGGLLPFHP